jgi:hypothetical protein
MLKSSLGATNFVRSGGQAQNDRGGQKSASHTGCSKNYLETQMFMTVSVWIYSAADRSDLL